MTSELARKDSDAGDGGKGDGGKGDGDAYAVGGSEHLATIAEASAELGVTQRTLRFYEDKGLINPRRVGAMRVYSKREMGRMRLIMRGKRLGFSIREIAEHLSLYDADHDPAHVEQTRRLLSRVSARLEELRAQQLAIEETIAELEVIEKEASDYIARR